MAISHWLLAISKFHFGDDAGDEGGTETLGLTTKVLHHRKGFHAVRVTGEVLHFGRGGQLSAELRTFDEYRLQVRACSVDSRRIARGTATDD